MLGLYKEGEDEKENIWIIYETKVMRGEERLMVIAVVILVKIFITILMMAAVMGGRMLTMSTPKSLGMYVDS